jgi:hypothetical protein
MMLRTRCFDSGMSFRNLTAHPAGTNAIVSSLGERRGVPQGFIDIGRSRSG